MTVCVVADRSGSMAEAAKAKIEQLVFRCIAQSTFSDSRATAFRFCHWNETVTEASAYEPVVPNGKAALSALMPICTDSAVFRVVLLSDGCFAMEDIRYFAEEMKSYVHKLRIIGIGGDADFYKLEKLCGKENVYTPENTLALLDTLLHATQGDA